MSLLTDDVKTTHTNKSRCNKSLQITQINHTNHTNKSHKSKALLSLSFSSLLLSLKHTSFVDVKAEIHPEDRLSIA
jgi:hypothetical protein